ncbi:hypothetical protein BDV93DRAFT_273030 [Ceratobasidium sp. AG-I]|nr:hypothetical protein BDV93DRAFT_273030 [Ceratobasidium sp. AG-I]
MDWNRNMSSNNNHIRTLPSPPPSSNNRMSFDGRTFASGSRSMSPLSSSSILTTAPEYDNSTARATTSENTVNVVHPYSVSVGGAMVDVVIRISTPKNSRDSTLTLTCQAGGVERVVGEPRTLQFSSDPSQAEFNVYFIPRESNPLDALFKFRVWLSSPGLQVRLWAEDEFWIGAQLPFPAIPGAHLGRLIHASPMFHVYQGSAGAAVLSYTVSLDPVPYAVAQDEYSVSLRYEAAGISGELCGNLRVRLSCDIKDITFIIYTLRQDSEPKGSRHKFRFWIRTATGGICQRLWAADDVWIGKALRFENVQQGTVIIARRGTSGITSLKPDAFSDPSDLPAYSAAPRASGSQ